MRLLCVFLAVSCLLSAAFAVQPACDDGEFLIDTAGVHSECQPAVAFDGANFLVVWHDYRGGPSCDIYGARVTSSGFVLDQSGIPISTAADLQWYPAVAFDGTNFLVVWEDGWRAGGDSADIYGARVTPGGTVLDPNGFVISQSSHNQYAPAVAFDDANFLVVWTDGRGGYPDIYGARVTPAGTVLDTSGIAISTAADYQTSVAVAFDGTNFLVVWTDGRGGGLDIFGARVSPAGTVLDPSGIAISTASDWQESPAVVFDGTNFLVVWTDYRSGHDIYAGRVTPAGTVLDTSGIAISTAADYQWAPAVAFDGTNSLVVWCDHRSGSDRDIYGAWVMPSGTVSGEGPVVRQAADQMYPALGRGAGGQLSLVYQGWAGSVGGKTYDTMRIWGKMNPVPGVEESPKPQATSPKPGPTIVCGVLFLPQASSLKPQAASWLLDISGRRVLDLHPGANDVRQLAPGVYFVRAVSRELSAVSCHKVVIQR